MSLLLDHGHPNAGSYPLGLLGQEAELVVERLNRLEATRTALLQMAVGSVLSEKVHKGLSEMLKTMGGES